MRQLYRYIVLLLILFFSCNKIENKKERIITVNVTKNDSVVKVAETKINDKYRILGEKKRH